MISDSYLTGSVDTIQLVEAVRKEGTLLEFLCYTGFLEKCQDFLYVGYMLLSYLGKDNNIVKIYKSKLPFNDVQMMSITCWNVLGHIQSQAPSY